MPLTDTPIHQFSQELASAAPAPGGGSAAALSGALGASLVAMVCRLTIGRKNYESVDAEFQALLPRAEAKRHELLAWMQADTDAYSGVMAAYQLPKDTDEQKAARTAAIQDALKRASDIPFKVADACADVLSWAAIAAAKGNKNAASDAGAGALMAEAGLRAAILNVQINLGLISDEAYVSKMRDQLQPLKKAAERRQAILDTVETRI